MQLYSLELVTVVAETVIMKEISKEGVARGASGCTLTAVSGEGSRSRRHSIVAGASSEMKCECVVPQAVADKILTHVARTYVEHYAGIAWVADAHVMRGETYLAK